MTWRPSPIPILDQDLSDLPDWARIDDIDEPCLEHVGRSWWVETPAAVMQIEHRIVRRGHWQLHRDGRRHWIPPRVVETTGPWHYYEKHRISVADRRAIERADQEREARWRAIVARRLPRRRRAL